MSQFVNCRESCGKSIIKICRYAKTLSDGSVTLQEINAKLTLLNEKWASYERYHEQVVEVTGKEEIDAQIDLGLQMEDVYTTALSLLNEFKDGFVEEQPSVSTNPVINQRSHQPIHSESTTVKLPTINLPTFHGNYEEWAHFKDIFVSMIMENQKLSNVQKLHYLKSSVSGEAERLLQAYSISSSNFTLAWNALVSRFENIRSLTSTYLQKIVDAPVMKADSSAEFRQLIDEPLAAINQLNTLNYPTDQWDTILTFLISRKLSTETRRQWELQITSNQYPTFQELTTFLDNRCRSLELLEDASKSTIDQQRHNRPNSNRRPIKTVLSNIANSKICPLCNRTSHLLYKCSNFYNWDVNARRNYIKDNNRCTNCLRSHPANSCKSMWQCAICRKSHHTLLHSDEFTDTNMKEKSGIAAAIPCMSTHSFAANQLSGSQSVLLATAIIRIRNEVGILENVRALIDQGSQCSFITESLVQRLALRKRKTVMSITGIGGIASETNGNFVNFDFSSTFADCPIYQCSALVIKRITCDQPSANVNRDHLGGLQELRLADPSFHHPSRIDVLLGADLYGVLLKEGLKTTTTKGLIAQNTTLGWILSGPLPQQVGGPTKSITFQSFLSNADSNDINHTLRKFWELDEIITAPQMSEEERMCEQHFLSTFYRNDQGRFVVSLPFKNNISALGHSRQYALSRFHQVERRLRSHPDISNDYQNFMKEYESMGHMERIDTSDESLHLQSYYIPHHHIIKESSTTTRLRVVFDASNATSTGISLNECLMVGPKLNQDIVQILLRWRTRKIAFMADIEKMYRQILVKQSDTDYQRILHRYSPTQGIQTFKLLTVTYGTSCAPHLAVRCLKQLALDEIDNYPVASNIIQRDFYVDDVMSGCDNISDALSLQTDLITILNSGQFHLRKWCSNQPELLNSIPPADREFQQQLNIMLDESVKALGLIWNPKNDEFQFNVNLQYTDRDPTKRTMLSDASRFFDPIGWLAPVLIRLKIQLQHLWLAGINWDDKLPTDLARKWLTLQQQLAGITNIHIPRWIGFISSDVFELHGFCDASTDAYAAVIFSRAFVQNSIITNFMISKTKVAPIKTISIPRLELCGALLLAKLIQRIKCSLELQPSKITAWTDSKIVLAWLKSNPCKWKTFVANRTTEILETIDGDLWHHIPSGENPADCATRGLSPEELAKHNLWWHGPAWLKLPDHQWPSVSAEPIRTEEEIRTTVGIVTSTTAEYWDIFEKFSNLQKLLRVTVYIIRYSKRLRNLHNQNGNITASELREANMILIRNLQKGMFFSEYTVLICGKPISGQLRNLNPFLDGDQVIRVGGRLQNSLLPFDQKHPIILPSNHPFTSLLIEQTHRTMLHGGLQLVLHTLRQRYWIINAKRAVRHIINNCLICFRLRVKGRSQLMGQLPSPRVIPSRPFSSSGVDFAGPITIRLNGLRASRTTKAYIAVFVCMAVKAIHLEVVSQLTSDAFIAAYQRFTSRRGLCEHLYSDNGTNFVGANTILKSQHKKSMILAPDIASLLATDGTEWHFIPPSSPHFGGLWEAGVKSLKTHLVRIMGDRALTFEELTTLTTQIEACLNSRPICAASSEEDDMMALTPAHFLIGENLKLIPEPNCENVSYVRRWKLVRLLLQQFWRQWSNSYLQRLQQMPKWWKIQTNLQVGQLVIVIQDNMPPTKWLLGRIVETHPGPDGLVRVVTINCARGTFKRPITKLCPLPFTEDAIDVADTA